MTVTPTRDRDAASAGDPDDVRKGVAYGVAAYLVWGLFPLFFRFLVHVPPLQVLAHRIVWSLPTITVILSAVGGWKKVTEAFRDLRSVVILGSTTVLIAVNWYVFILAVDHGEVLQSSAGYFINPLVSVFLGYVFLRERMTPLEVTSLAAAVTGVAILFTSHGAVPWIALVLALTFGLYGLLRKIVFVDAATGLFVETLLLFPLAFGYIAFLGITGRGSFVSGGPWTTFCLFSAGVITAVPLLWFSASARRLRLSTIGFMQYITPTMHFFLAVFVFREPFDTPHLASFACIWTGLFLYSYGAVRGVILGKRRI